MDIAIETRMKKITFYIKSIMIIFFICMSNNVFAACGWGDSGYPGMNAVFNFGDVIVQRDQPIGTVLKSVSVTYPGGTGPGCDTNYTRVGRMVSFQTSSSLPNVFQTNINGIGITVSRNGIYFNFSSAQTANVYYANNIPVIAELIKLSSGASGAGTLTSGTLTNIYIAEQPNLSVTTSIGSSNIIPVACTVSSVNLTFPIGDILASKFGSVIGTVPTGGQNTQNLGLNCDAGANINATLKGTQNPDVGTTSVLALTGQGNTDVAKGVGVQLLYNGTPLVLNQRIVLKQSTGGQETFPITARYYQTKTAVTTGKANASATLDLTYQ
ncbi:fimbrial protein [Enterobacter kobei]|uniref:fimbrial protein n=1 Tax=Enterobacter kobei TaxID=208224 RepID=UPI002FD23BEB